jgi:hypothetical protein
MFTQNILSFLIEQKHGEKKKLLVQSTEKALLCRIEGGLRPWLKF